MTGSDVVTPGAAPTDLTAATPKAGGHGSPRALREPARAAPRSITTIDQCFASASNFAVGVVVARVSGPAGLGAYSVAYTLWLAMAAAHRAAITDPMSIENDAMHEDADARAPGRPRRRVHLRRGASRSSSRPISLPLASYGARAASASHCLTLAPFVPFLLVQDYWRWVGFMQARPDRSLRERRAVQRDPGREPRGSHSERATLTLGGNCRLGRRSRRRRDLRTEAVLGGAETPGRGSDGRVPVAHEQVAAGRAAPPDGAAARRIPLLAGPAVGDAGLGGLKAAQSLVSGPSLVLLQAGGSIGLPEASRAFEKDGWAGLQRVARWVTFAGVVSVGSVSASSSPPVTRCSTTSTGTITSS